MKPMRVLLDVSHWHLMRAPESLQIVAIKFSGSGPALRSPHDNHWPANPLRYSRFTSRFLRLPDLVDAVLGGCRHRLVHAFVIGAFHEIRRPSIAAEKFLQLLMTDTGKQSRII